MRADPVAAPRGAAFSERLLQDAVLEAAALGGWLAFHPYDSRRSAPGWPDLALCHPRTGRLMFLELKTAKGRLTGAQKRWLDVLGRRHDARVVRPADLGALAAELLAERRAPIPSPGPGLLSQPGG